MRGIIHGVWVGGCLWLIIFWLAACSFKVEFGYHGETGRDDRTQSQLKKGN